MDNKTKSRLQKLAGIDEIKVNTPSLEEDAVLELTTYVPISVRYYADPDEGGPIPNYNENDMAMGLEPSEFLKVVSQKFDQVLKNPSAAESAFFNIINNLDDEDLIYFVETGLEKVEDLEVKLYRGKFSNKTVKFKI